MSFPARAKVDYYIAVDGDDGAYGPLNLHWSTSPGPPNNMFSDAEAITDESGTRTGENAFATRESGEPHHAGVPGGRSVWYRWTAPATRTATFETDGSDFDTLLAVYLGSRVEELDVVAANDDTGGAVTSRVRFARGEGTVYVSRLTATAGARVGRAQLEHRARAGQ